MTKKTKELRDRAIAWARARGLHVTGSHIGQALKLEEEAGEVVDALNEVLAGRSPIDALMLEIGDVQVVLAILCELAQISQDECFEMALKKIESRTGSVINGVFVKDGSPVEVCASGEPDWPALKAWAESNDGSVT